MNLSDVLNEFNNADMNMLFSNKKILESHMEKEMLCPLQTQQEKLKVIFQFPPKSIDDEIVKNEVKEIITSALHEQLFQITS